MQAELRFKQEVFARFLPLLAELDQPTFNMIDKQGNIHHWRQGELNWNGAAVDKTIEQLVNRILAQKA